MPELSHRNQQLISSKEIWSNRRDNVSYNQLQKFWSGLSLQARRGLLRIDKQTLFERARKNMYCSRCNGLLLEGFSQILVFGKSLQQEEGGEDCSYNRQGDSEDGVSSSFHCRHELDDPSVHPLGGLITTRDGSLTLLDCYLCSKQLKGLYIVFERMRARARERELCHPNACGVGGRGWISQASRGHGTREGCTLHNARVPCDTLLDFWSALGDETKQSLLRMKEDDFIERLMHRFDSKRFCRDCRKNVIREYKELKELKRMRREPRCTKCFCVADTSFQYEVSDDTIQADWNQALAGDIEKYDHFEWAVGKGKGNSDILAFENVGLALSVRVSGLDLGDLSACYITLRAWKLDGRCTEFSVKAHALQGRQCVHGRLIVGDGFVTITEGESIRRLFEHAEEAEEEEDDDLDEDGSDLGVECSRPQKHAKTPELARQFLLDAAAVIFKEQVEKAYREGTARQNAHNIFVCLALKLLEEQLHNACKELVALKLQNTLLEEEEKEKREEEERKEKRRIKEREKKLRRKGRLKGKEMDKENRSPETNDIPVLPDTSTDEMSCTVDDEANDSTGNDSISEPVALSLSLDGTPELQDKPFSNDHEFIVSQDKSHANPDGEVTDVKDGSGTLIFEQPKFSRWKSKFRNEVQLESSMQSSDKQRQVVVSESGPVLSNSGLRHQNGNLDSLSRDISESNGQTRPSRPQFTTRNCCRKSSKKLHCPNYRTNDKHDFHSTRSYWRSVFRAKAELHADPATIFHESKLVSNTTECTHDMANKSYPRSFSDTNVTLRLHSSEAEVAVTDVVDARNITANKCRQKDMDERYSRFTVKHNSEDGSSSLVKSYDLSGISDTSMSSTCHSDSSSCLSDGDGNIFTSNHGSVEFFSTLDSEDTGQKSEEREASLCIEDVFLDSHEMKVKNHQLNTNGHKGENAFEHSLDVPRLNFMGNLPLVTSQRPERGMSAVRMDLQHQRTTPLMHNQCLQFPVFQAPPTMGYYQQNSVYCKPAAANGFLPMLPRSSEYFYAGDFGYGFSESPSMCVQYNPVQCFPTPLHNSIPVPVYQPAAVANGLPPKDNIQMDKRLETSGELRTERKTPKGTCLSKATPNTDTGKIKNPGNRHTVDKGFSLFQFDSLLALSTGSRLEANKLTSDVTRRQADNNPAMKEYNLFATSEVINFSLSQ